MTALSLLLSIGGKGVAPGVVSVLGGDSQHDDFAVDFLQSGRKEAGARLHAIHAVGCSIGLSAWHRKIQPALTSF